MESSRQEFKSLIDSISVFRRWRLPERSLETPFGVKPDTMTAEEWKLKDRHTLGLIWFTLSRNMTFNIIKERFTMICKDGNFKDWN